MSRNSLSHFKLILYGFLPGVGPHIKFHPNRMNNAVSRAGPFGLSKNSGSHLKLILMKNAEVQNVNISKTIDPNLWCIVMIEKAY